MLTPNSVKSSFRDEIIAQLGDQNLKKERKYILKMVLNAVNSLYGIGIYIYPNIIEFFQINGFKASSLLCDAISNITDKIRNELKGHVEWISNRTLKKGNMNDKNIILCYLLFTYREHFINYLHDYLLENKQNQNKIENLVHNLQKIINDAQNNHKNNVLLSNKLKNNKNKNVQNSNHQNIRKKVVISIQDLFDDKFLSHESEEFSYFDNGSSFF